MSLRRIITERVKNGVMPKYFYHGTSKRLVPQILKEGLTRDRKKIYLISHNNIYFCDLIDKAYRWGVTGFGYTGDDVVVLRIDSSYLDPECLRYDIHEDDYEYIYDDDELEDALNCDFDEEGHDYEYTENVPPEALSVVDIKGNTKLLTELTNDADSDVAYWWNLVVTRPGDFFNFTFPASDRAKDYNPMLTLLIRMFHFNIEKLDSIPVDKRFWEVVNTTLKGYDKPIGEILFYKPNVDIKKYQQWVIYVINETFETMPEMLDTPFAQYIIQQLTKKDQKTLMQALNK